MCRKPVAEALCTQLPCSTCDGYPSAFLLHSAHQLQQPILAIMFSILHISQTTRLCNITPFGRIPDGSKPLLTLSLAVGGERLGELGALADGRALPIEDVDGDGDDEGQAGQNGARVLEVKGRADVGVDCGL